MRTLHLSFRASLILGAALVLASACRDRDPDPDAGGRVDAGPCTPSGAENTLAACGDNVDNDCNGFRDCNEFACCGMVTCDPSTTCGRTDGGACTPSGAEDTEAACMDSMDNDCNGFRDCRDFACSAFCGAENSNARCINGADDDMDGFLDCEDNDCMMRVACAGEATNANCSDGMDNNGMDGVDCADPDCQDEAIVVCDGTTPVTVDQAQWAAMVESRCTNDTDDEGDGRLDCGEFSCLWNYADCTQPPRENTNALCSDGMDNDLDGTSDCDDTGCSAEGLVVCDGGAVPPMAMWGDLSDAECMDTTTATTSAARRTPTSRCAPARTPTRPAAMASTTTETRSWTATTSAAARATR
jgi:hypothetical protein